MAAPDDMQDVNFNDDDDNNVITKKGNNDNDDIDDQEFKQNDNNVVIVNDNNNTKQNQNQNKKNNKSSYASINLYRPQRTSSPRTIKIISTEERKGRVQKHTVYVIEMDPSPPGVITVARRYNDFKWLRTVLSRAFPGVFVPPLPPGNIVGRFENKFIEERRQDLERFLNRIEEIKPFAESMAFGMFLSRPETTFFEGKKEVESQIDVRTESEIASILNKLFPDLFEEDLDDNVHTEDIPLLRDYLFKIDVQMNTLNKSAIRLYKHLNFVSKEISLFNESFDGLYSSESNYPYKATAERLDIRPQLKIWSLFQTKQTDCYYDNFFRELRYEHEDIKSLLELFKCHEIIYKKYMKLFKAVEKWKEFENTNPNTDLKPKDQRQKDIDYKLIKEVQSLLDIVTKIILKNEIILIWNNKTSKWRDKIQVFSQTQNQITNKMLNGWKNIALNAQNDD